MVDIFLLVRQQLFLNIKEELKTMSYVHIKIIINANKYIPTRDKMDKNWWFFANIVSHCCLMSSEQLFSYIMARIRWWWCSVCTRPTCLVGF